MKTDEFLESLKPHVFSEDNFLKFTVMQSTRFGMQKKDEGWIKIMLEMTDYTLPDRPVNFDPLGDKLLPEIGIALAGLHPAVELKYLNVAVAFYKRKVVELIRGNKRQKKKSIFENVKFALQNSTFAGSFVADFVNTFVEYYKVYHRTRFVKNNLHILKPLYDAGFGTRYSSNVKNLRNIDKVEVSKKLIFGDITFTQAISCPSFPTKDHLSSGEKKIDDDWSDAYKHLARGVGYKIEHIPRMQLKNVALIPLMEKYSAIKRGNMNLIPLRVKILEKISLELGRGLGLFKSFVREEITNLLKILNLKENLGYKVRSDKMMATYGKINMLKVSKDRYSSFFPFALTKVDRILKFMKFAYEGWPKSYLDQMHYLALILDQERPHANEVDIRIEKFEESTIRVNFSDGRAFCDIYHGPGDKALEGEFLFVIDDEMNMFILPESVKEMVKFTKFKRRYLPEIKKIIDDGALQMSHHVILSGKPVACAGDVRFSQGKIVGISNRSDHYMPSFKNNLLPTILYLHYAHNCFSEKAIVENQEQTGSRKPYSFKNVLTMARQKLKKVDTELVLTRDWKTHISHQLSVGIWNKLRRMIRQGKIK